MQVLKRLREERLLFDPHVRALEELVQTKTNEIKTAQQKQRDVQREKELVKAVSVRPAYVATVEFRESS